MAIREISSYHLGDMLLVFEEETEFHRVGFYMIPWSMQKDRVLDRKFYRINSLAQVKIAGDMYPNCYGNGQTMRNGESANRMTTSPKGKWLQSVARRSIPILRMPEDMNWKMSLPIITGKTVLR